MIKKMSSTLVSFMLESNTIKDDEQEIYQFCYEYLLENIIYFILVIALGILLGHCDISIIFLAVLTPLRTFGGGIHASTQKRCTLYSYGLAIFVLILSPIISDVCPVYMFPPIYIFSAYLIWRLAPVETKNKPLDTVKKAALRHSCHITICLLTLVFFMLLIFHLSICFVTITICVMIAAVSMLLGHLQNRRNPYEYKNCHMR